MSIVGVQLGVDISIVAFAGDGGNVGVVEFETRGDEVTGCRRVEVEGDEVTEDEHELQLRRWAGLVAIGRADGDDDGVGYSVAALALVIIQPQKRVLRIMLPLWEPV